MTTILVLGLTRTGSTWLFNAASLIAKESGQQTCQLSTRSVLHELRAAENRSGCTVIKSHRFREPGLAAYLVNHRVKVLLSLRDADEIIRSRARIRYIQGLPTVIDKSYRMLFRDSLRLFFFIRKLDNFRVVPEVLMRTQPLAGFKIVADYLDATSIPLEALADSLNISNVKDSLKGNGDATAESNFELVDPESHWHRNHIAQEPFLIESPRYMGKLINMISWLIYRRQAPKHFKLIRSKKLARFYPWDE